MRKKALKIVIPILIVIIAIVTVITVILLIPHETDFNSTYVGYSLEGLNDELGDDNLANDVLEHMDIDCNFTFKYNPISYHGEGTVTYEEKKLYVSSSNLENFDTNVLALLGNTGLPYSWLKLSKDTECFMLVDYNSDKSWIAFPKDDITIGEIRDRIVELRYGILARS